MQVPQTEILVRAADGSELLRTVLAPGEYVLGREAGCDLRFEAELVSRRHAQLTLNFDHALIEDLGSSNGTSVNGKPVTEITRLWPGQKIQLGSATVELRRQKTLSPPGVSLAPNIAITRQILPDETLRDRKYDIGGVVAQGGMGAILNAMESAIQRAVAMKVMLDGSSPDDLVRFIAEARVTGQLEHPNIVPVHELGVDENDQVFYTMKFVKGVTLRKVLEQMAAGEKEALAKYPLATLLTIFQKVCDAVAFAHSKGVIHRDLKPENIMLGDFGEVLLMDWGLAKILGKDEFGRGKHERPGRASDDVARSLLQAMPEAAGSTMGGAIMGTPQYMAPEQARGEVDSLDARADIYALGAILYHLLALRPSVQGEDPYTIVEAVARGEIDPLVSRSDAPKGGDSAERKPSTIPDSLAAVVGKAMAFDRDRRYQTVGALQADITAYQTGFATAAEEAGLGRQVLLLIQRHKGIFLTGAAAWLLISALAVWFVINLRAKERRATAGEGAAIAGQNAARQALAKSALSLADASLREANGPAMQAALDDVPVDLRDSTWSYLRSQANSSIAPIRTETNEIESVAADPSRPGVFAVADRNQKVTILNVHTGERLLEFQPGFAEKDSATRYCLAFSPNGRRLAIGRDGPGGIVIHRAREGSKETEWEAPASTHLEFGNVRKLLQQTEGGILLWDVSSAKLLWEAQEDSNDVGVHGAFLPGGKEVVTFSPDNLLRVVKAQDGSLIRELGGRGTDYVWKMKVCPDGQTVFTWNEKRVTECVSLQDGKVLFTLPEKKPRTLMSFTRDGVQLVTVAPMNNGLQSIEVWNAQTGDLLRSVLGGSGEARALSVHPLSDELLVTGPESRAWDLTGAPPGWQYPIYWYTPMTFWGGDDLVYAAPNLQTPWGLQRLKPGEMESLAPAPDALAATSAVSADGRIAALWRPGFDHDIHLFRKAGSGIEKYATIPLGFTPYRVRLSPNGDRFVAMERVGNQAVSFVEAATGKAPFELELKGDNWINDLGWVNNQRLVGLLTLRALRGNPGSEERIILWDTANGRIVQSATHRATMDALAVAPDGTRLAEGGTDKRVRIRDAATLTVLKEFRAHDGDITALAWHPTRPILATGSSDLSIRLWNLETGEKLEEIRGPLAPIKQLTFSPSGQRLGCASADGFARIWDLRSFSEPPTTPKNTPPVPAPATLTPTPKTEAGR